MKLFLKLCFFVFVLIFLKFYIDSNDLSILATSKRDEKSDDGENFELIENVTSFGHQ